MATYLNRREVLAGLLMSVPSAATIAAALADERQPPAGGPDSKHLADRRPPITISRETTYITEPLRPDGYPDYVAALNQRCSRGVTPENNAAVPFWRAIGPSHIAADRREAYFKMLGIAPLPEKGDYFRSAGDQIALRKAKKEQAGAEPNYEPDPLDYQLQSAMRRPWSRQEFPVWAEWLDVNERPLALLTEASKRPRRYDPWFDDEKEGGIDLFVSGIMQGRDVAWAFAARAMLRLHDGKTEEAWQDVLACHRLARLIGQGPTLFESMMASIPEAIAQAGDCALIEHAKLTSTQLAAMRKTLASLSPLSNTADVLDIGERFFLLSFVLAAAGKTPAKREGFLVRNETGGILGKKESSFKPIFDAMGGVETDWDTVLRMGNAWFNRLVETFRNPRPTERRKALAGFDKELKQLNDSVRDTKSLNGLAAADLRKVGSKKIGQACVCLYSGPLLGYSNVMDRTAMHSNLTQLAFALAGYRADHGGYPEKLADLAPQYIPGIAKDIFNNDADLRYARQADGYLLYSVGPNGRDDGGRGVDDHKKGDEGWDDIVVRMPSAKP
jgi:hypothetical protein